MCKFFVGICVLFTAIICQTGAAAQVTSSSASTEYPLAQANWVEMQMKKMNPEERIGQLFMIATYSNKDEGHKQFTANLLKKYNIGGVIFMQGTALQQAQMTNYYQAVSKIPLLVSLDAEWGLNMRLNDTPRFPKQLTLGAIQDNRLIYEMGREIARESKRIGTHVNFAPVVDINNNPNNPVINDRSFGEDKYNVTAKGLAYMQGMEMGGIIACAKHFPGHGDTDTDSHHALPIIKHSLDRLLSVELHPFREMAQRGIGGMMVAHLSVPALDNTPISGTSIGANTPTMPTTLSKRVVTDLLKDQFGYTGLVFTDALNMQGVAKYFEPGIVDVKALLAGNDVLLFSQDVGKGIEEIQKAIKRGEITQEEIDSRVRKILKAKYRVGLHTPESIPLAGIQQDISMPHVELLQQHLYENALTLVQNNRRLIPFNELDKKRFASLSIGVSTLSTFQETLGKYAPFAHHTLKMSDSNAAFDAKFDALKSYDPVVISIHDMSKSFSRNFGISPQALKLIGRLQQVTNVVITVFGSPYSLKNFDNSQTVLMAYEENKMTEDLSAQLLFGAIAAKGKLPITASSNYVYGQGLTTSGGLRLKYTIPEDVGISRDDLQQIDFIAQGAVRNGDTPGCQVLIAKDGKVIYQKSFGYHTYKRRVSVKDTDLYDLASITKVASTIPVLMDLEEQGQLNLYSTLGNNFPELKYTNKSNLFLRDILIHESGLRAWIPFYEETIPIRSKVYKTQPDEQFSIEVAKNMYMDKSYVDKIFSTINDSDLPTVGKYKYSDLGYFYFKKYIENKTGKPLNEYVEQRFYQPLGLSTMGYLPTKRFSNYSIVPSEYDGKWRRQEVNGYVHDMGAAMLGGVGGHAGLFSNANDLAILMQMLLNNGWYGGQRYLNAGTIQKFTSYQKEGNRRGLGFDKPEPNPRNLANTTRKASGETFGHTGFTGTCVWADPQQDLVYVFLSNRTFPNMDNFKLVKSKVRERIHEVVYDAIEKGKERSTDLRF
ncbi:MAG: glycoside hydrolase family 3 N-terminal domain-containing protein [Chitinophagales bacterium]